MTSFVYKWTKDTGEYYVGKRKGSPTQKYIGSGVRFREDYDKDPSRWTREILNVFVSDKAADLEEAALVTSETLSDPLCLNSQTGGNGGCSPQSIAALPRGAKHHDAKEWVIRLMVDQRPVPRTGSAGRPSHGKRSWNDPIVASGKGILPKFCKDNKLCEKQLGKTARGLANHNKFYYAEHVSK